MVCFNQISFNCTNAIPSDPCDQNVGFELYKSDLASRAAELEGVGVGVEFLRVLKVGIANFYPTPTP